MALDVSGFFSKFIPGSGFFIIVLILLVVLVLGIIIGGGAWLLIDFLRYKKKIIFYENSNGILREVGRDVARIQIVDKGLATLWYLKKLKRYIQPLVYSSGNNQYSVIRKSDGDLENFQLSIDAEGKQVIAKVIPTGLRMANANIRRYFRETYKKESFFEKYGKTIMYIAEMVVFALILVYILYEVAKIIPALGSVADKLAEAMNHVNCVGTSSGGNIVR